MVELDNCLAVNCDVDELFGLRVIDDATDNYVNVYANYLLDCGQAADDAICPPSV